MLLLIAKVRVLKFANKIINNVFYRLIHFSLVINHTSNIQNIIHFNIISQQTICMKLLSLLLFLIISISSFAQYADTLNIYKFTYLGKNYEIVKEKKTWKDAAACAVERGGYLVQIENSSKQMKVYDEIINGANISTTYTSVSNGGAIAYVWIGATDQTSEGDWKWDIENNGTGSQFWSGGKTGSSVNSAYQN